MSFSLVQNVGIATSGVVATFTKSWTTGPTAGNLIVVVCWAFGSGASALLGAGTVTDNKGNTFSLAKTVQQVASNESVAIHYLIAPSTYTGYSVTVSPTGSSFYHIDLTCTEFSTTGASPTVDVSASNTGTSQPTSGTTGTTNANCGLWVAGLVMGEGFTQASISTPTGFTDAGKQLTGAGSQAPGSGSYAITGTLASVAASAAWTVATTTQFGAVIATFTSAPSAITTDVTTDGALSTTGTVDVTSSAATTAPAAMSAATSGVLSVDHTTDATSSADLAVGHTTDVTTTAAATAPVHVDATTSLVATRSVVSNLDLSTAAEVTVTRDLTSSGALARNPTAELTMDAAIVVPRLSVTTDAALSATVLADLAMDAVIARASGAARSFAMVIG